METATAVLADIFIMFLAAKVAGELFERIRQPPSSASCWSASSSGRTRWAGSACRPPG